MCASCMYVKRFIYFKNRNVQNSCWFCRVKVSSLYPHWLQNKSVPRPLYLEAQQGSSTTINVEVKRTTTKALPPTSGCSDNIAFVPAGHFPKEPSVRRELNQLDTSQNSNNLRPDLIMWLNSQKSLYIVELTVPWACHQ